MATNFPTSPNPNDTVNINGVPYKYVQDGATTAWVKDEAELVRRTEIKATDAEVVAGLETAKYVSVKQFADERAKLKDTEFVASVAGVTTPLEDVIYVQTSDDSTHRHDGTKWIQLTGKGSVSSYADLATFPATGKADIVYIAQDTSTDYYWNGANYVSLKGGALALTTIQVEAVADTTQGVVSGERLEEAFVSKLENLLTSTATNKAPTSNQVKILKDFIDKLASLLGVALTDNDWGAFTGDTIPDNATSLKAILQVVETKLNEIELLGDYLGSSTTFAGLPATNSKNANDWASLTNDDVGTGNKKTPQYPKGLYITDGTDWTLFMSLRDVTQLTLDNLKDATLDQAGTISPKDLTDWINDFTVKAFPNTDSTLVLGKTYYGRNNNTYHIPNPSGNDPTWIRLFNTEPANGTQTLKFTADASVRLPNSDADIDVSVNPFTLQQRTSVIFLWNNQDSVWELELDSSAFATFSNADAGKMLLRNARHTIRNSSNNPITFKVPQRVAGIIEFYYSSLSVGEIVLEQEDMNANHILSFNGINNTQTIGLEHRGSWIRLLEDADLGYWNIQIIKPYDPQTATRILENITLSEVRSIGTDADSEFTFQITDVDGNVYPAADWAVTAVFTQYASGTAVITYDKTITNGTLAIGRNKSAPQVILEYIGLNPNGVSAFTTGGVSLSATGSVKTLNYQGTNYSDVFQNGTPLEWTANNTVEATDMGSPWIENVVYPIGSIISHTEEDPDDEFTGQSFNWRVTTAITEDEFAVWDGTNFATIQAKLERFAIGIATADGTIPDWTANTAYVTGDKVVAPMPINADFISSSNAIAGVEYIFEATADRPNTIASFNDTEADSGNWKLVGTFRVSGTDSRIVQSTGTRVFDPLTTLSNSSISEFIEWTTTDNPQKILFAFNPSFITVWKDYTGLGLVQPTNLNDEFDIPPNCQFLAHRNGNAIQIVILPNEGGSSAKNILVYPTGDFTALPVNDAGEGDDGAVYKIPVTGFDLTLPSIASMDIVNGKYRVRISGDWSAINALPTKPNFVTPDTATVYNPDGLPDNGFEWLDLVADIANNRWEVTAGGDVNISQVVPAFNNAADVPSSTPGYQYRGTGAGDLSLGLYMIGEGGNPGFIGG